MTDPLLHRLYIEAVKTAHLGDQVTGEKSDYFVTLQQLEELIRLVSARPQPTAVRPRS